MPQYGRGRAHIRTVTVAISAQRRVPMWASWAPSLLTLHQEAERLERADRLELVGHELGADQRQCLEGLSGFLDRGNLHEEDRACRHSCTAAASISMPSRPRLATKAAGRCGRYCENGWVGASVTFVPTCVDIRYTQASRRAPALTQPRP